MKALSVRQPWAAIIADGRKTLEVRSWPTSYRGPLLICAASQPHRSELARRYPERDSAPRGCAICVVQLVDVREGRRSDRAHTGGVDPTGQFVWVLSDPESIEELTPVRGRLGLFDAPAVP